LQLLLSNFISSPDALKFQGFFLSLAFTKSLVSPTILLSNDWGNKMAVSFLENSLATVNKLTKVINHPEGLDRVCKVAFRTIDVVEKYASTKFVGWNQLGNACQLTSRVIESADTFKCIQRLCTEQLNKYEKIALVSTTIFRASRLIQFSESLGFNRFKVISSTFAPSSPLYNMVRVTSIIGMSCQIFIEAGKVLKPEDGVKRKVALWAIAVQISKIVINIFEILFSVFKVSLFASTGWTLMGLYFTASVLDLGLTWNKPMWN
jgi:hypothetical protein